MVSVSIVVNLAMTSFLSARVSFLVHFFFSSKDIKTKKKMIFENVGKEKFNFKKRERKRVKKLKTS